MAPNKLIHISKLLIPATVHSYSNVLFSNKRYVGVMAMCATFIDFNTGIIGLIGILASNVIAMLLGVNEDRIKKGLYGFNGLLLAMALGMHYQLNGNFLFMLLIAIALLIFIHITIEHILGFFFGLPVLSLPFVIVTVISSLALYNYHGFTIVTTKPFFLDAYFPQTPDIVLFYLKSMGAIFFQNSPWAGMFIMSALLIFSRIAFILSIIGFMSGYLFHLSLSGDMTEIATVAVGFNYILTCVAVGGIFLIPNVHTFILGILATLFSAVMASFMQIFMVSFSLPVLTFPFVTVTLLFLYSVRLLYNKKFRMVDFLPGSPESNLDYFKAHLERFGETGLEIRLPFLGKWLVTQGYNGEFTHKSLWQSSLDFMAVAEDNLTVRKKNDDTIEDYLGYGLPVFSVAHGTVIKVIQHLEDNILNEINVKENWGNLVLIQHGPFLYSLLCHLKKESVLVKEGETIPIGTRVGLTGNSGRSGEPHIHLHFQSNPEIGSPAIPVTFTQYLTFDKKTGVSFNCVPSEKEVLSNINADYNSRTFFNLAPGVKIKCNIVKNDHQPTQDVWQARVDFLGSRYLENEKGDKLFFYLAGDYFASLDYQGSRHSALFVFFLAFYRLPFININATYNERMSYKYFSSWPKRVLKDMVQPFTNLFSYKWIAEFSSSSERELQIQIVNSNHSICKITATLHGTLPGTIIAKFDKGEIWKITTI